MYFSEEFLGLILIIAGLGNIFNGYYLATLAMDPLNNLTKGPLAE